MQSQSHIQVTLSEALPSPYMTPADFKSEAEFQGYFETLPINTQIQMADANIAAAQRYLASYYHDKQQYDKSMPLWNKAAAQKDPVALLRLAELCCHETRAVEGDQYLNLAIEAINNSSDKEFKDYMLEMAKELKPELGVAYLDLGFEVYNSGSIDVAKKHWQQGLKYGNATAVMNLAQLAMDEKQFEEAIKLANQSLNLIGDSVDKDGVLEVGERILNVAKKNSMTESSVRSPKRK